MKVAVIGKTGQLARALKADLPDAIYYGREDLDLSAPPRTITAFMNALPQLDVVIIAAAYTNVDKAESEPEIAYCVNARAPAIIAKHCADRGTGLIYISTDCVFDGTRKAAYAPQDTPHPVNFYGATKLEGERAVMQAHPNCTIVRTSWVYAPGHTNFVSKMVEIGAARGAVNVVADQIGRPTYAPDLAKALIMLAEKITQDALEARGIYHITNGGAFVSRADWARAIFEGLNMDVRVTDIPTRDFPTPAQRGLNAKLDISEFEQKTAYAMADWRDGLRRALKERQI